MVRYCPHCGRNIPQDARICPYCAKTIGMHEGITQDTQPEKKDKTLLIIAIVIILVITVPIAIAATVYVYVSGMLGPDVGWQDTPIVALSYATSDNDCTLTIEHVELYDLNEIKSSDVSYRLVDNTDGEEIDFSSSNREVSVSYNYDVISTGNSFFIKGGINDSDELEKYNEYRFNLIYDPTGEIMGSVTWDQ